MVLRGMRTSSSGRVLGNLVVIGLGVWLLGEGHTFLAPVLIGWSALDLL